MVMFFLIVKNGIRSKQRIPKITNGIKFLPIFKILLILRI